MLDRIIGGIINGVFPQGNCIVCTSDNDVNEAICHDCRNYAKTLMIDGNISLDQFKDSPTFTNVFCAYTYSGCIRTLIHKMKFEEQPYYPSRAIAPRMAWLVNDTVNADVLVPVPLSRSRILERGYNQSTFLAREISRRTGIKTRESLLWRTKETARQSGLGKEDRVRNVKNAFASDKRVKGLHILLVDDVLTTGSSASACAKALLDAGAKEVSVVTAAQAKAMDDK